MSQDSINVVVGGQAGQGLVTIGQILAKILIRCGYSIVVTQSYQSRVRGGHNTYNIRISPNEIQAPREPIDLLIALDMGSIELHRKELNPNGLVLADQAFQVQGVPCLCVPYSELSPKRYFNIAALGVASAMLGLDLKVVRQALEEFLAKDPPEMIEGNRKAFEAAVAWEKKNGGDKLKLSPAISTDSKIMINGNEAIALGAISAGMKFYSFYPMTPATSIGQALAGWAKKLGLIVEQAEDEISVINMALGASFAGAPSMVGTSGGGFALMVEGVSLAGMTETPIVIVIGQRPAPATGLPTRTEQGDLEFALHSGHGEFPRAIFAPGSIEDCFTLTRKAFQVAEAFQAPAFILTDQFLADSYRAVSPFQVKGLPALKPWAFAGMKVEKPYQRYSITDPGVSPRLLPGFSENLVIADSDEHAEDGHLTEDLVVRRKMVEKRLRKGNGLRGEGIMPGYQGDEKPEVLLVCWGSTKGSVLEAASLMREKGTPTAALHFSQVWPLIPEQFIYRLQKAAKVIAVEGNANGQFARLIRRETGFHISNLVLRYDGLPITPEYILRALNMQ
jgi:2-oxoglutarate/2-oxoacid ferredoxin oxidoreductase subunit alpha